jgi:hypothetical protein
MFADTYCSLPRDILQASMRIRHVKDPNFILFLFTKQNKNTFELNYPEFYESSLIYKKLTDNIILENCSDWIDTLKQFCKITNYDLGENNATFTEKIEKTKLSHNNQTIDYPYSSLKYKESEINEILEKEKSNETTMLEMVMIKKFFFDRKYLNIPQHDREYLWDSNSFKPYENLRCSFVGELLKDNEKKNIYSLDLNNIVISDNLYFRMTQEFNCVIINPFRRLLECLNSVLGMKAIIGKTDKNKNTTYTINNRIELLEGIYNKAKNNPFKQPEKYINLGVDHEEFIELECFL